MLRRLGGAGVIACLVALAAPLPAAADGGRTCADGVEIPTERDVVYGASPEGIDLKLDVWVPQGIGPFPSILVIHGALEHGDKNAFDNVALAACLQGFVAFNANYRLSCAPDDPPPEVPPELCTDAVYPEPSDDLALAMAWIRAHAAGYDGSPDAVAAMGSSGGGTLAMTLATTYEGEAKPEAAASWSGWSAMWVSNGSADPERLWSVYERYLGCPFEGPDACPDRWIESSAVVHATSDDVPFYAANGTLELIPKANAALLVRRLARVGVEGFKRIVPLPSHGRQFMDYVIDADTGTTVTEETFSWLLDHVDP